MFRSESIFSCLEVLRDKKKKMNFSVVKGKYRGFPSGSGKEPENLPAKQETQVGSLGQEDLLEEDMATHSSFLAWEFPWREEPGGPGYSSWGHKV